MKLKVNENYKSLSPFECELPDFTILTGINGSGKTQLLTGIIGRYISVKENGREITPNKYIPSQLLIPNESKIINREDIIKPIENLWTKYNEYKKNKEKNKSARIEHSLDFNGRKVAEEISKKCGKNINNLNLEDFHNYYPFSDLYDPDNIFFQNFSIIFKRYNDKYCENKYKKFLYLNEGRTDLEYISDEDFKIKYGDFPWLFVNEIFKEARIDYEVNTPGLDKETSYELKLINNLNGATVPFKDLSSGEKVIMSLALALYNSKSEMEFPKLLLLDEPDASLHPSMTKQFIDVLQNVFVKEKNVKVIMTTHSPSTVALAPEEALHLMNKDTPRLIKVSKDLALKKLTSGVPSLSIDYENRRQVFVESKNDVQFFEKIYEKLKNNLISERSLSFISSGSGGSGSSSQVKDVVNQLNSNGNRYIYGIIDWDGTNMEAGNIKVLGYQKRYSIENYIFDPLLLGAFLLREQFMPSTSLGLNQNDKFVDFKNFEVHKLQSIVDKVTENVSRNVSNPDMDIMQVSYVNGTILNVPKFYLQYNGHNLIEKLKTVFPALNRFANQSDIILEVMRKIVDELPEFIPTDLLEIFKSIQEN